MGKDGTLGDMKRMNVTDDRYKNRKPQRESEGYLGRVSAEQKEEPRAFVYQRITETKHIDANFSDTGLLEKILDRENLNKAYRRVVSNKGVSGVDEMSVYELMPYLKDNKDVLLEKLRTGKYKPRPVLRVEIPKETKGEYRKLGIPTVIDRLIQQGITQVLSPIYEKQFSKNSYGFRPKRSTHDALKACKKNADEGYKYVVDMDLEKFFDTVCQSKLIEILSRTIKDGRVISLIHKYLNAGVINKGKLEETKVGMPQGGNLSPLLSNIMLNELDKELERRGHKFVRYADDCMIFCKSKRSAERTLRNILPFIEGKLKLKVNRNKSKVAYITKVKYLGYSFYFTKGKCRFRAHPKSIEKMKKELRRLTSRNNGWSNEVRKFKLNKFIIGWVNYFSMADMKSMLERMDEWLRRRIRQIYWKQWKKVRTRYKMIKKFGIPLWKVHEMANCRKATWRAALMLNSVLTKEEIAKQGYMSMLSYYTKVRVN